jgi:hypothetical protein
MLVFRQKVVEEIPHLPKITSKTYIPKEFLAFEDPMGLPTFLREKLTSDVFS